ncbi:MAG: competence type IV pilus major pilin ComGC [Limisphaerales bacterium]
MIVVAIIGLLAAIAIPNFVKARATAQKNSCVANLKQIDGAVQQWRLKIRRPPQTPTRCLTPPCWVTSRVLFCHFVQVEAPTLRVVQSPYRRPAANPRSGIPSRSGPR